MTGCGRDAGCSTLAVIGIVMAAGVLIAANARAVDAKSPLAASPPGQATGAPPDLSDVDLTGTLIMIPGTGTTESEAERLIERGDAAQARGQTGEALEAYQGALSRLTRPEDERLRADLSSRVAVYHLNARRYADGEPSARSALAFYTAHRVEDLYAGVAEAALAEILANTSRVTEAIDHQQLAVLRFKAERGSTDEATLIQIERLGEMQLEANQYHEAADTFGQVDAEVKRADGHQMLLPSHNAILAEGRFRVGVALKDEQNPVRALQALQAAYGYLKMPDSSQSAPAPSSREQGSLLWAKNDPRLGVLLVLLSNLERWNLDNEASLKFAALALEVNRQVPDSEQMVLTSIRLLGDGLRDTGKLREAERYLEQAQTLSTRYNGASSLQTFDIQESLAENWKDQGRTQEAILMLRAVLPKLEKAGTAFDNATGRGYTKLAWMLAEQDQFQEAHAAAGKAVRITERHDGADSVSAAEAWEADGYVYEHWQRPVEAERSLRHGYDLCVRICGSNGASQLRGAELELAAALGQLHRNEEARPLLRAVIADLKPPRAHDTDRLADANWLLAKMAFDEHHYAEAEPYAHTSYDLRHKADPTGHNTVLSALTLAAVWIYRDRNSDVEALLREMGPVIQKPEQPERFRVTYQQMLEHLHPPGNSSTAESLSQAR